MHISLKKQIHDKKISNILKLNDIVLFFAIFDLPQKKRQDLKIQVAKNLTNLPLESNSLIKNSEPLQDKNCGFFAKQEFGKTKELQNNQQTTCIPQQLYISNKCARYVLEKYLFETFLETKSREEISAIVSANIKNLPLYGQTLLVACRREEQANELYKYTSSLYNTSLLGGFYKNSCKTREFLKAMLNAASKKVEIYKEFLRVLSMANYKFVQTTTASKCKLLVLLKKKPVSLT